MLGAKSTGSRQVPPGLVFSCAGGADLAQDRKYCQMSSRTQPQRQQAELKRTPHQSDLGKPTTTTLWVNELIARYADATETGTGRRTGRTVKGEVNPTAKEGKLSFPPAHAPTCGPVPPRPRKAPRCRGSPTSGRRVASAAGSRPLRRKAAESRGR